LIGFHEKVRRKKPPESFSPDQPQPGLGRIRRILVILLLVALFGLAITILAAADLMRLGGKEPWSDWDRLRVAVYLKGGSLAGRLIPPIGPLAIPHHAMVMADAYLGGHHPPQRTMQAIRRFVLNGHGLRNVLEKHEQQALQLYAQQGQSALVRWDYVHRFYFLRRFVPLFDDWAMCLRTDIVKGKPVTGFFVWGLGIVGDKRAPAFFGRQLGIAPATLDWFNRLGPEGLATGYWINLTESPETSFFSPGNQRMSRGAWSRITGERHWQGHGHPAAEL
jgi:hypothetical protein